MECRILRFWIPLYYPSKSCFATFQTCDKIYELNTELLLSFVCDGISSKSPIITNSINIHYWNHHMISDVMCIWISSNLIFIAKVDNIYHQGSFLQLYKMRFHLWINLLRYYLPPNYLLEHLTLFLMVFLPRMKQKVKMNDRRW